MTTRWRMVIQIAALVPVFAVSLDATAATIYGRIQENNQPVKGKEVILDCQGSRTASAVTDDGGNYRITTARSGACNLIIGDASGNVVLYPEPTQYNFEIVRKQLIRR